MRFGRERALVGALAVVLAAASAACGGDDGGSAGSGGSGDRAEGGSLTYVTPINVESMDPVTFSSPASAGAQIYGVRAFAVYDALVWENWETGEVEYRLVESMDSDDGREWTLSIRPDVAFSDGTPLDAEALKFNLERIQDPANQAPTQGVAANIASMEAVDELTLRVVLDEVDGQFPRTIANYFPFVGSPAAIEEHGADFGTNPVGAGAFVLDGWQPSNDTMTMRRNPGYFEDVNLDELVIRVILDGEQALNTLTTGGADMMASIDPALAERAEGQGLTYETVGVTGGGRDLIFNTSRPPFDDVRARRAVAMAVDTDRLLETLYGEGRQAERTLFTEGTPFHDPSLEQVSPDAEAAQELFDEIAADGEPVSFELSLSDTLQNYGEAIQAQMAEFDNVSLELDIASSLPFNTNVVEGNYQMAIYGHAFIDPSPIMDELLRTGTGANLMRYSNPEMDAALAEGHASLDEATREAAYREAQEIWIEDVPFVLINRASSDLIHTDAVGGLETFGTGTPRWDLIWTNG